MTRPAPTLTSLLKNSVSHGALYVSVESGACFARDKGLSAKPALSVLARMRIWLRLIFGRTQLDEIYVLSVTSNTAPLNRTCRRRQRRALPLARRADRLADVIYRRFGRGCYLQWIYNRILTPRFRWCFTAWNWSWRPRSAFLCFSDDIAAPPYCGAVLRPD